MYLRAGRAHSFYSLLQESQTAQEGLLCALSQDLPTIETSTLTDLKYVFITPYAYMLHKNVGWRGGGVTGK